MKYIEYYKCRLDGTVWRKEWDDEDLNDDFTQCPECEDFEFDEITEDQFKQESIK